MTRGVNSSRGIGKSLSSSYQRYVHPEIDKSYEFYCVRRDHIAELRRKGWNASAESLLKETGGMADAAVAATVSVYTMHSPVHGWGNADNYCGACSEAEGVQVPHPCAVVKLMDKAIDESLEFYKPTKREKAK
jgi:hypothetical protein